MNGGKSYRTTQDIGETKWCSNSPMLRIGYLKKWFAVLARVEDRRKGFNIAWTRTILKILVRSSNPRTFRKYNQSCIARQCIVTRRISSIFLSRRKRKQFRSTANRGLIAGGVILKTGRQAVFFTDVNPMDNQDGVLGNPMRLVTDKNRAIQKYLEILSGYIIFGATWSSPNKEDCNFIKQDQTQSFSTTHCLQSSLRKRCTMKTKDQLYQRESVILRPRVVLRADSQTGSQDLLYKKQDHLGKDRNKMRRATRKPEATLLTSEYLVYRAQRWNCTMHGDKITSQSWLRCSKNNSIRNFSLKTWVISRRSTGSSQKYSKIWAPQFLKLFENSAKHQRLHCFSVTEIGFLCCSCVFTSILGFVIKKNPSRGPKHGQSERQIMFLQGEEDAQESETVKARPTWKILLKDVDLGEPTSFLDHIHLCWLHSTRMSDQQGYCGQLQKCFRIKDFCLDYWKIQKQKATVKPDAETISSWFFEIWEVMQRNAWRYCEFANKTIEQCFKSQRHAWKIINSKKKKMDQL